MWDQSADGYGRGDGFASVVLKSFSAALADNDNIIAIVRETGTNQDGRTNGITMPSSEAQTQLIRQTYARAGLDINAPEDRPQFFEAHGTGTPAGDPVEAKAIHDAFFDKNGASHQPLYVGSIKTVFGHTEGTAGLAGVLKTALALKNAVIPPNMLFERLNPAIKPFYGPLQIPTREIPWPDTLGQPRRASVNSFGFGGSNAHAILEHFDPIVSDGKHSVPASIITPFTLSAMSEKSLAASLRAYLDYVIAKGDALDPYQVLLAMDTRRSKFPCRISFAARDLAGLRSKIEIALDSGENGGIQSVRQDRSDALPFLGIFTGQGAQWAGMGRQLLLSSEFATNFIHGLEARLAALPDTPSWSLREEILADGERSRVAEAAISQPLCTAIQLLVVEILRTANINFDAVVGHSSGEIAAAYAAGAITVGDAIVIAYYRGFHAHLASALNGERGAMLAADTSLEDARELCELPDLRNKLTVAASNSPSSVTFSGDESAIQLAKDV